MSAMGDPRAEAERLVAAALAALSVAANSTAGFATGSAECCACPLCKAIAAARDPDPEFAAKLAGGVGDLATGVASVLRAFSSGTTRAADPPPDEATGPDEAAGPAGPDDVWSSTTDGVKHRDDA